MFCKDCKDDGKVVWFLRHQKENEDDEGTNANVVTILCQTCGRNQSAFLVDYLPDIFPDWDEEREIKEKLFSSLGNFGGEMDVLSGGDAEEEIESDCEKS